MNWIVKIWNSSWWGKASAILAVVIPVGGWIGDKLSDGWVVSVLQTLWEWIKAVLFFEIPIYWMLLFAIIIIVIYSLSKKIKEKPAPFLEYTKDMINGCNCTWSYDENGNVTNVDVLCVRCQTPMLRSENEYLCTLKCPRGCGSYETDIYSPDHTYPYIDKLEAVIKDNIRRKYEKK